MNELWFLDDPAAPVNGDMSDELLRRRRNEDVYETWLTSSRGRSLAFVTNETRAMVLLLDSEGDPGEHAVDPEAGDEFSDGFMLANGQSDEYPDTETVPFDEGLRIVKSILDTGMWPTDANWVSDR